jgi:ATP-dependent Clp endopeptidase proteolytic subunit ClpP
MKQTKINQDELPFEIDMQDLQGLGKKRTNNYIIVNEICEAAVNDFREDFFRLECSDQEIIPIIVDSYGGDVYALHAMLSIIESSTKKIATICDGKAFSCGAILLSAGDHGMRFISKYGYVLVHQVSHEYYGKFSDIAVSTEHCSELNSNLLLMLDKNCRKKAGSFEKMLIKNNNSDLYLDAKTSLQLGIVDHIGVPRLKVETQKTEQTMLLSFSKKNRLRKK